jgi:hypothetical protein
MKDSKELRNKAKSYLDNLIKGQMERHGISRMEALFRINKYLKQNRPNKEK